MHLNDANATRLRPAPPPRQRGTPPPRRRQASRRPSSHRAPQHRTTTHHRTTHHHSNGVTTAPPEPRLSVPLSHERPVTLQLHTYGPSGAQTGSQRHTGNGGQVPAPQQRGVCRRFRTGLCQGKTPCVRPDTEHHRRSEYVFSRLCVCVRLPRKEISMHMEFYIHSPLYIYYYLLISLTH